MTRVIVCALEGTAVSNRTRQRALALIGIRLNREDILVLLCASGVGELEPVAVVNSFQGHGKALDTHHRAVLVFEVQWVLQYTLEKNPHIDFRQSM